MPRDEESLWEYLHRKISGLRSPTRDRVAPVLVFDQFEEIFTLGRSETRQVIRQAFLRDLADCVENRLPEDVHKEMNRTQPGGAGRFADLEFTRQDYRVVLSLREDYLAELHDLSDLMPSIHENETRLVPLNGWQALDAVAIPGEALVEPVVAREIVEIVAASRRGETTELDGVVPQDGDESTDEAKLEIDPALLSMVCRGLNEERQRRKQPKITQEITNDLLKNSGRSILHRFYTECFQSLPDRGSAPEVQKFVEDDLLTPTGYRNMAELVRAQNRLANSGVPDPSAAIQRLIDQRLLRISERRQDKTKWLELTHDVLCDVVKESRHEREVREAKEREEREEQERAAHRLAEAERQRAEAEAEANKAREREADALARLKQMRRERRLGIAALILTICFVGALLLAGYNYYRGQYQTGAEAQRRGRILVEQAKERVNRPNDDRRNVVALRQLARALRLDPANKAAAALASQLLLEKIWCPPLSKPLRYPDSPLLCVGLSPNNREIVAVAADGNLVRWSVDNYERLENLKLVSDKMTPDNKKVLDSAAFSRDGKRILMALVPPNREKVRVCNWSEHDASYRPSVTTVDFKDPIRSLAWSHDGNLLCLIPQRFDQSNCRVFSFEGRDFRERTTIPNATAADLTPDDNWLAIAQVGGRIQLWDTHTLQPAAVPGPDFKTTLEPAEPNPDTRYFFLVFSGDGQELAATAMKEPARIWNMRDGTMKWLKPKSQRDQIMRVAFAPSGHTIVAGVTGGGIGNNGMLGMWDTARLDELRAEPMCLADAMVYPNFSADGKTIVTLSGAFWNAMDTVRAWDVSLSRPVVDASKLRVSKKSPPPWLADLADAVSGMKVATEDDETSAPTLSELRKKYAGSSVPEEYKAVWNRFLANAGQ